MLPIMGSTLNKRFLYHGLQIIKHNKIVDYTEGNAEWEEVMSQNSETWHSYSKFHGEIVHRLADDFKNLLPTWEKIKEKYTEVERMPRDGLKILGLIDTLGVTTISQLCSIYMEFDSKNSSIVSLSSDRELSPLKSQAAQECNGIVIDLKEKPKVICTKNKNST
jgi:hypothetical protein